MNQRNKLQQVGFTILELLVVVAIIAVLTAIFVATMSDSREKGRDTARKTQLQEVIKAIELYYSDYGFYPDDGTTNNASSELSVIGSQLVSSGYLTRLPEDDIYGTAAYQYCASDDLLSITISVNTEQDFGGSNYCSVTRGTGNTASGFGCTTFLGTTASDPCATRF